MPRSKKVVINHPMNWVETDLSESVKSFYFDVDDDGNVKATPTLIFDPTFNPTAIAGHVKAIDITGVNRNVGSNQLNVDFVPTESYSYGLNVVAAPFFYNNVSGEMEVQRTPNVFKSIFNQTVSGTIAWDPAAGKKFRLMGGVVTLGGPALAAAAINCIKLVDEAESNIITLQFYCPVAAASLSTVVIPFTIPGNGFLSATADNRIIVNLTTALSAGAYSISVWGTEE